MVAISGFGGAAVMWHFLSRYVQLSRGILIANLVFFLAGVVLVLGAIFVGGFAAAWTFLFPLPAHSLGIWSSSAAATYLVGVLLVGVGFLLFLIRPGLSANTAAWGARSDGLRCSAAAPRSRRRPPLS
jgi:cytochrome c oxidase subunit 1